MREDFFKQKEMKKLRRMAGGNTYTIIYLKMQLLSVKNYGVILFESIEENLCDELALELDETSEDVQMTLMFLQKHGLIEQITEDEYLLREAAENIGTESASAERMRKHREQQNESHKVLVSHCDTHVTERDKKVTLEKEKDIDLELYPPKSPQGESAESSESETETAAGARTLVGHSKTLIASFEDFWDTYPRKQSKNAAEKAWIKIASSSDMLLLISEALEAAKKSDQWQRENGRYIPMPAKWLREKRWLDKPTTHQSSGQTSDRNNSSYDLNEIDKWINSGGDIRCSKN